MRSRSGLFTWAFFVLILAGSFYLLFAEQRKPLTITLADPQQPGFGLVYVADAKGYFTKYHLHVTYIPSNDYGTTALEEVADGRAELGLAYDFTVVRKLMEGVPLDILTTLHYSYGNAFIATNTARHNAIRTVGDLAGKKVATVKGTYLEYFLYSLLDENDVKPASVTIEYTDPSNLLPQLESGAVDASTFGSASSEDIASGTSAIPLYSDAYTETSLVVGIDPYLSDNSDAVTRFLKALADAQAFYLNDPSAAEALAAARLARIPNSTPVDWSQLTFKLGLDNALLDTLRSDEELIRRSGLAGSDTPRVTDHIKSQYLKSVAPETVTIF